MGVEYFPKVLKWEKQNKQKNTADVEFGGQSDLLVMKKLFLI